MVRSTTKDDLSNHINDLDCQIEYLEHALRRNMVGEDEEHRLNSLLVKRACFRKELEETTKKKSFLELIPNISCFSRTPKRINDYF